MKRFHVHVHVDDLAKNIAFYSAMFNQAPARTEGDYAKWMLEDPPVNFAISTRGTACGVDHLGIQVDNKEDLEGLRANAANADIAITGDRITFVGDASRGNVTARRTIDARGLIVAPGFIDPHTHALEDLSSNDPKRRANVNFLMQGVTTVIAPGKDFRRLAANQLDGGLLASMAVSNGSFFLRTDSHLYRIMETIR